MPEFLLADEDRFVFVGPVVTTSKGSYRLQVQTIGGLTAMETNYKEKKEAELSKKGTLDQLRVDLAKKLAKYIQQLDEGETLLNAQQAQVEAYLFLDSNDRKNKNPKLHAVAVLELREELEELDKEISNQLKESNYIAANTLLLNGRSINIVDTKSSKATSFPPWEEEWSKDPTKLQQQLIPHLAYFSIAEQSGLTTRKTIESQGRRVELINQDDEFQLENMLSLFGGRVIKKEEGDLSTIDIEAEAQEDLDFLEQIKPRKKSKKKKLTGSGFSGR